MYLVIAFDKHPVIAGDSVLLVQMHPLSLYPLLFSAYHQTCYAVRVTACDSWMQVFCFQLTCQWPFPYKIIWDPRSILDLHQWMTCSKGGASGCARKTYVCHVHDHM